MSEWTFTSCHGPKYTIRVFAASGAGQVEVTVIDAGDLLNHVLRLEMRLLIHEFGSIAVDEKCIIAVGRAVGGILDHMYMQGWLYWSATRREWTLGG